MKTRIFRILFGLMMITFLAFNISEAQTVKRGIEKYPTFSITPYAGIPFPIADLKNSYKTSFGAGIDFNLKINKETAFFLNGAYYNMPLKSELSGPDAFYIAVTAGPRYIFSSANLKANFFIEAGLGAYVFNQKEYNTATTPSVTIASTSKAYFGVNAGPGAIIPVSKDVDIMMRAKLHYIFNKDNTESFIGAAIGLNFKL